MKNCNVEELSKAYKLFTRSFVGIECFLLFLKHMLSLHGSKLWQILFNIGTFRDNFNTKVIGLLKNNLSKLYSYQQWGKFIDNKISRKLISSCATYQMFCNWLLEGFNYLYFNRNKTSKLLDCENIRLIFCTLKKK